MAKKLPEIPREELYYFYIEQNLTQKELADKYKRSLPAITRALRKCGIRKPKELARKSLERINMEKHGVSSVFSLPETRAKSIQTQMERYGGLYCATEECKEKIKQANIEKYGVEWSLQNTEVRQKGRETLKEKYGGDSPLRCPEIKAKALKTIEERYGTPFAMQSEEVRSRQRATIRKRYGVDNVSSLDWVKEKKCETTQKNYGVPYILIEPSIRQKMLDDCERQYGVKWYKQAHLGKEVIDIMGDREKLQNFILSQENKTTMYLISVLGCTRTFFDKKIKEYHLRSLIDSQSSLPEKILGDYLTEIGIKWEKSKQIIKPLEIDFFIPSLKIGFEYNGNYWHNKNKKGEGYHLRKTELGLKKGVQIFHIFEYEWLENPEGIKEYIRLLTTKEGERNLKNFLDEKCSSVSEIISDVSKESDEWYISRGFECASVLPPTPTKCNVDGFRCREGEKEFCVVYNCGYKIWKRR